MWGKRQNNMAEVFQADQVSQKQGWIDSSVVWWFERK